MTEWGYGVMGESANERMGEKICFESTKNKIRQKLYSSTENSVKFNNNLFRSDINFPTNAPEGK